MKKYNKIEEYIIPKNKFLAFSTIYDYLLIDCNKYKFKMNIKKQGYEKDIFIEILIQYRVIGEEEQIKFKYKKYLLCSNETKKDININLKKRIIVGLSLLFSEERQHPIICSFLYKKRKTKDIK
jgi:hypothetical protein